MRPVGTGVWSMELRYLDPEEIGEAAAELDLLGYSAIWIPDSGGDVFGALDRLLAATSTITVATGILNIWKHPASQVAAWLGALPDEHRARVLVGLGISHGPLIGAAWRKPMATTVAYLDELDANGAAVEARCLAALGPKMLELARDRTAGAHPYLVTPEHTALAREMLGPDSLLAVEQGVVLETDLDRARSMARRALGVYTGLPNYVNNWKRLGFTDDDVVSVSDRLVDALFAMGDAEAIAARLAAHRQAGADHVCIQVLSDPGAPMPRPVWRELALAVID
jgi:probable F420-dependent oxidoreductase